MSEDIRDIINNGIAVDNAAWQSVVSDAIRGAEATIRKHSYGESPPPPPAKVEPAAPPPPPPEPAPPADPPWLDAEHKELFAALDKTIAIGEQARELQARLEQLPAELAEYLKNRSQQ
jgi:hypothetical protein